MSLDATITCLRILAASFYLKIQLIVYKPPDKSIIKRLKAINRVNIFEFEQPHN